MKVLHICNDYFGGPFYNEIFGEMELNGISNTVLVFIRKDQIKLYTRELSQKNSSELIVIPLDYVLSFIGRLFPSLRNVYVWKVLKKLGVNIEFDLLHAHTIYSNGSLAYYIHNRLGTPYVLSARNTDINTVLKYFQYQTGFVKKVLIRSSNVFSPAPSYVDKLKSILFDKSKELLPALNVIPNPVGEFWISNIGYPKVLPNKKSLNVLFVGEIADNKNIPFLISTFNNWSVNGFEFIIRIVGKVKQTKSGLKNYEELTKLLTGYPNVEFFRDVSDKTKLKEYYREADLFCMVSRHETFGLVYIESMSQGTPVLYTNGEGIDGYFAQGEVGYPVEYNDVNGAREKVTLILNNYSTISANCISYTKQFSKEKVTENYISCYKKWIK